MFFGSFFLFDEDNSLNYDEFELTEFMTDEELENYRSKADGAQDASSN